MKIAIVTGCSGLIGSQSVKFLTNKGFLVVGIDNHTASLIQLQLFTFFFYPDT